MPHFNPDRLYLLNCTPEHKFEDVTPAVLPQPHMCVFRVRIIGSSTLALCQVATGAAEAYYQYGLHCWDIAAAALIITEAGGCVIDTTGQQHSCISYTPQNY